MQKLQKKLVALILLCVLSVTCLAGCQKAVALTVKVGDATFTLEDTVVSLYEQGLYLMKSVSQELTLEQLGMVDARTMGQEKYTIGVPTEDGVAYTGIYVRVYNEAYQAASVGECKIYQVTYENIGMQEGVTKIAFGDVCINQDTPQDALDKMKATGIDFVSDDAENAERFTTEEYGYFVSMKIGNIGYKLYSEPNVSGSLITNGFEYQTYLDADYN